MGFNNTRYLEEKIEALESTIKFLKEEIETYKLGVSVCKSVLKENRKLKIKIGDLWDCLKKIRGEITYYAEDMV